MVFSLVNVLIFLTVITVFVYYYYGYRARKQENSREEMFGFFIGILIAIISSLVLIDVDKIAVSQDRLHVIIILASFLVLTVLNLFMRYKWHIHGLREFRLHVNIGRFLILICVVVMIFKTHTSWVHHI